MLRTHFVCDLLVFLLFIYLQYFIISLCLFILLVYLSIFITLSLCILYTCKRVEFHMFVCISPLCFFLLNFVSFHLLVDIILNLLASLSSLIVLERNRSQRVKNSLNYCWDIDRNEMFTSHFLSYSQFNNLFQNNTLQVAFVKCSQQTVRYA